MSRQLRSSFLGYQRLAVLLAMLVFGAGLAACSGDEDSAATNPAATTAQSGSVDGEAAAIESAIARASSGVPNVRWDGESDPSLVRFAGMPDGYAATEVVSGLKRPTNIAVLPDGRILVTEQHEGTVRVVMPDGQLLPEPFATLRSPAQFNELGTVGIVAHPDFPNPPWVYVFNVEADALGEPSRANVYRFAADGNKGTDGTVVLELPATTSDKHNGGAMVFGPDGKLYISLGDLDTPADVQSLATLAGKILRINDDGSTPRDNPFVGVAGADERVFAYGFRNTYGLDWHPDLEAWIGADNATTAFDEINLIQAGENYGHPVQTGYYVRRPEANGFPEPRMPIQVYLLAGGLSGLAVYDHDELGEFKGDVLMCQIHRGSVLHRLEFDDGGEVTSDTILTNGCSGDVVVGPDGAIYFVDVGAGAIHRIARSDQ